MAWCGVTLQVEIRWLDVLQLWNWKSDGLVLCNSASGNQMASCFATLELEIRWLGVVQLWNWKTDGLVLCNSASGKCDGWVFCNLKSDGLASSSSASGTRTRVCHAVWCCRGWPCGSQWFLGSFSSCTGCYQHCRRVWLCGPCVLVWMGGGRGGKRFPKHSQGRGGLAMQQAMRVSCFLHYLMLCDCVKPQGHTCASCLPGVTSQIASCPLFAPKLCLFSSVFLNLFSAAPILRFWAVVSNADVCCL